MGEKEQAERLNEKYDRLVAEKDEVMKDLDNQVRKLDLEKEALEQQLANTQEQLEIQTSERKGLETDLRSLQQASDALVERYELELVELQGELEAEKAAASEHVEGLRVQFESEKEKFETAIKNNELELHNLQGELEKERADRQAAREQVQELSIELEGAKEKNENLEKRQQEFDHIVSGLREDMQRAFGGKAAADEIAHECRVQLKELQTAVGSKKSPEAKETAIQPAEELALQSSSWEWPVESDSGEGKETKTQTESLGPLAEALHQGEAIGEDLTEQHEGALVKENLQLQVQVKELEFFKANAEHILQGLREDLHSAMNEKHILQAELRDLKIKLPSHQSLVPVVFPVEVKQINDVPSVEGLGPSSLSLFNLTSESPQKGEFAVFSSFVSVLFSFTFYSFLLGPYIPLGFPLFLFSSFPLFLDLSFPLLSSLFLLLILPPSLLSSLPPSFPPSLPPFLLSSFPSFLPSSHPPFLPPSLRSSVPLVLPSVHPSCLYYSPLYLY